MCCLSNSIIITPIVSLFPVVEDNDIFLRRFYHEMMFELFITGTSTSLYQYDGFGSFPYLRKGDVDWWHTYICILCHSVNLLSKKLSRFRAFQLLETSLYNCHSTFYLFVMIGSSQKVSYHLLNLLILHSKSCAVTLIIIYLHERYWLSQLFHQSIKVANFKRWS